jgi:hypothetical protein
VLDLGLVAVLGGLARLGEHAEHLYRADACEDRGGLRSTSPTNEFNRKTAKVSRDLINCFRHAGDTSGGRTSVHPRGRVFHPG